MAPARTTDTAPAAAELRELFWHNIVQEWLTLLPAMAEREPSLLDGRLAVVTRGGERVPIRAVHPVFACSVGTTPEDRALSMAVQCTVFEIHTPTGEVIVLPLHEIRAIHAMSEELAHAMEEAANAVHEGENSSQAPFGFAAFTSLSRSRLQPPGGGVASPAAQRRSGGTSRT